ncbi:MAG: FAD-dependent oxidoreductase, partial [Wenzhouxiangellaceae bacterium]
MLRETAEMPAADVLTADTLIVGGGLAGLTLARELAQAGQQVAIFESGGTTIEPALEALNDGVTRLHGPDGQQRNLGAYLRESRCRCLGGSGNLWGGKCAELDPIDFEHRRWINHS